MRRKKNINYFLSNISFKYGETLSGWEVGRIPSAENKSSGSYSRCNVQVYKLKSKEVSVTKDSGWSGSTTKPLFLQKHKTTGEQSNMTIGKN